MSLNFDDLVGRPVAPPTTSPYPVSEAMIVHWCEALDDDPARYRDAQGPYAPPTMLHIFNMPGSTLLRPMPASAVMNRLDQAGFPSPMATNYEQDYGVPIRLGDRITQTAVIEAVSPEKQTPMGAGHFVSMRFVFANERGEEVGRQLMRVFKYRAGAVTRAMAMDAPVKPWSPQTYPPPAVVAERDRARPVLAGDALPDLAVELTPSRIVLGAIASNDPMPVHHDADTARAGGVPNIFMNILTQNGWVGRYVQQWAGSGARLRHIALRLGVPNVAHDTMVLSGRVVSVEATRATLEVASRNRLGEPVRAQVTVDLG
ncbi:MAG TPA: MaoC family dehydratase N-terminal domain-containing protein [Steroidobacteraceae bacterium]|nr:MaoC family dehydratase N-terminal domain-containing protein [Steroidobacteraceae bacterium]